MLKMVRAASVVAISCTLASAVLTADAGFAFGNDQSAALSASAIVVDAAQIASDQENVDSLKSGEVTTSLNQNGDIVFIPTDREQSKPEDAKSDSEITNPVSSLAELVGMQDVREPLNAEERCLASAVYFESKGESLAGQLAVARVVIARSQSGRFPSTLCGVVYQKSQFSFVRGGGMPPISTGSAHWRNAVAISRIALNDSWKSPVEGALFFHARHVSPGWRLTRIGSIDNHIFYR